jgi:GNAT superfamily N-acetyltransferase
MKWMRERFELTDETLRIDFDVVHGFLTTSYWSPGIPRDVVERAARGSLCFSLLDSGGQQVGFARVISDRATFAYLADVFILPAVRGKGLGLWMMEVIRGHPELKGLRRWMLATRDAHALYRKVGFGPLSDPTRFMERLDPDVYRREASTAPPT